MSGTLLMSNVFFLSLQKACAGQVQSPGQACGPKGQHPCARGRRPCWAAPAPGSSLAIRLT